jgi:hypothetical protein
MTLTGFPEGELQETLRGLERLHQAAVREYQRKQAEYQALSRELSELAVSVKNLWGSIGAVKHALGLPIAERAAQPELVAPPLVEMPSGAMGVTETVMYIVAQHQDSGGIGFDEILQDLTGRGHAITREYLHTILNRKKNHQKKLVRNSGKWFLTDKGKAELGIK